VNWSFLAGSIALAMAAWFCVVKAEQAGILHPARTGSSDTRQLELVFNIAELVIFGRKQKTKTLSHDYIPWESRQAFELLACIFYCNSSLPGSWSGHLFEEGHLLQLI